MPRTRTISERVWAVGEYTDTVNQFNSNNTDMIVATLTRVSWPGTPDDNVARVEVTWSDGTQGFWELPGGQSVDKFGNPGNFSRISINIPEVSDGQGGKVKRSVNSGTFKLIVRQQLTSAITIEAV